MCHTYSCDHLIIIWIEGYYMDKKCRVRRSTQCIDGCMLPGEYHTDNYILSIPSAFLENILNNAKLSCKVIQDKIIKVLNDREFNENICRN